MIQSKSVDGFILLYSLKDDPIEHLLNEFKVPYLIVGKSLNYENIIHIDNDNIDAAYQLTQYLYHLGHRHILFYKNLDIMRLQKTDRWDLNNTATTLKFQMTVS